MNANNKVEPYLNRANVKLWKDSMIPHLHICTFAIQTCSFIHQHALQVILNSSFYSLSSATLEQNYQKGLILCTRNWHDSDYNEKLIKSDWDYYYWTDHLDIPKHFIGSGAIVVQLNQPYIVDWIKLFLLDDDDQSYSYYIEVSTDKVLWNMIVDKRNIVSLDKHLPFLNNQLFWFELLAHITALVIILIVFICSAHHKKLVLNKWIKSFFKFTSF